MSRLDLPNVTLCAIDARSPGLAVAALQRSMAKVDFGAVKLFTHGYGDRPEGIDVLDVGPITSGAAYSHFVLRRLPAQVHTGHVLVTQWDGFVVDAAQWDDAFLEYDYIGAVWPDMPAALSVGNGGFSLRSRRVLQASLDPAIETEHPEDEMLCRQYRTLLEQRHGVRFAPPALARRFAFENEDPAISTPSFGFHGPRNLPRVLDAATLAGWLEQLPDEFFRTRDARRLARALLAHRMPEVARQLIARRRAAGRNDPNTRLLGAAARLLSTLQRP